MKLPKALQDLFRIETNPIVSVDETQIPEICVKEKSRVILDNLSASPVIVHYRKNRKVVDSHS